MGWTDDDSRYRACRRASRRSVALRCAARISNRASSSSAGPPRHSAASPLLHFPCTPASRSTWEPLVHVLAEAVAEDMRKGTDRRRTARRGPQLLRHASIDARRRPVSGGAPGGGSIQLGLPSSLLLLLDRTHTAHASYPPTVRSSSINRPPGQWPNATLADHRSNILQFNSDAAAIETRPILIGG